MTSVVVTGGAGFIGSHVCEFLLGAGHEVLCVDNFLTGAVENIEHLQEHEGFRLLNADVCAGLTVPGPVGAVLHLASPASPADYLRFPVETLKAGSLGTLHALDLARAKGARFLLASTSEVYGDPEVHPQPEHYWGNVNPVGPRSVYDEAKRFAEAATTAYRARHGLDTAIVRLFNAYGPRMRRDDGRAVPTFIDQALRGAPLTVTGDGTQTRSVCYIDDTVAGIARLLGSDHPGPVNVGHPQELPLLRIAELVRELTGSSSPITFIPLPQDDPRRRRPDISLARRVLDWSPAVPAQEGLRRTIEWYRHAAALA
ncbi:SDR family oxidoreductase [Streptomyces capparidis]